MICHNLGHPKYLCKWTKIQNKRWKKGQILWYYLDRFFFSAFLFLQKLKTDLLSQVARFSKWIKCVQENAWKGLKDTTKIKQACNNAERYSLPRCDHTQLFFEGRVPWLNNDYQCCDGTDYNNLCKNYN